MYRGRVASIALACVVLAPVAALAQASITGVVRDTSGAVLPGVTVEASSPALIERVRSVVTDGRGVYRIVDLRPGSYTVTFSLQGFNTLRREGIELTGAFVATVNADLRVGALEETITVTAESPIVDVQSVRQQRVFTDEVLEAIPAGRSYINTAVLLPGVNATQAGFGTLVDVGGTRNLQTTSFTIHGGRASDSRVEVDGVRIGNALGTSAVTNFAPDQGSTQEVVVDYGAMTAEQAYGGLRINLVPREGGNSFSGLVFVTGVNGGWQSNNISEELVAAGLPDPNRMRLLYDINPSIGGPILRDRLWFYTSARFQEQSSYVAGVYENINAGDPTKWTLEPDTGNRDRQGVFYITHHSVNTRLTLQAAPKHKISIFYDNQWREWLAGRPAVSPETSVDRNFPINHLRQVGWTSPITNRLVLEARLGNRGEAFGNKLPLPGDVYADMIPVLEQSSGIGYRGQGGNGGFNGERGANAQDIWMANASATYVTGAHALKFGFSNNWSEVVSTTESNTHNLLFRFNNGVPNQLTMYDAPRRQVSLIKADLGVYAQDRWTLGRATLNLGVRYDHFKGAYPEQHRGPTLYLPNRNLSFPAATGNSVHDVTPRLGVAYDLFGTGRTALKVNLGKFPLAVGPTGNPAGVSSSVNRSWNDANGNFHPDCDLLILQANGECGTGNLNFGQATSIDAFDPDIRFGWGTREYNWEFSTGIQHQLVPRVGVDFMYFRRVYGNFRASQIVGGEITSADYSPYCVTAPQDSRLPNGGGYEICDLWNLNQDKVGLGGSSFSTLTEKLPGSPKQTEHWNGVDLTVNARLQNGLVIQGGMSTGRTTTDDCEVIVAINQNPSQRNCGPEGPKFDTNLKALATYTIPRADVNVAGTLQSIRGSQLSANRVFTNAEIIPSLGRPLSGTAQNTTINLLNPGDMYGDRMWQFDLRFGKPFRFGRRIATVNLDIYNAFNANTVLAQSGNYANWRTPQRIMDGRLFKLSGQVSF